MTQQQPPKRVYTIASEAIPGKKQQLIRKNNDVHAPTGLSIKEGKMHTPRQNGLETLSDLYSPLWHIEEADFVGWKSESVDRVGPTDEKTNETRAKRLIGSPADTVNSNSGLTVTEYHCQGFVYPFSNSRGDDFSINPSLSEPSLWDETDSADTTCEFGISNPKSFFGAQSPVQALSHERASTGDLAHLQIVDDETRMSASAYEGIAMPLRDGLSWIPNAPSTLDFSSSTSDFSSSTSDFSPSTSDFSPSTSGFSPTTLDFSPTFSPTTSASGASPTTPYSPNAFFFTYSEIQPPPIPHTLFIENGDEGGLNADINQRYSTNENEYMGSRTDSAIDPQVPLGQEKANASPESFLTTNVLGLICSSYLVTPWRQTVSLSRTRVSSLIHRTMHIEKTCSNGSQEASRIGKMAAGRLQRLSGMVMA
ncbi:hypothetical protein K435DRAFT_796809 [Dendrothele bispora CBS 962.96]|uniref:Uncharacterized protein n=1 Tax=Dendrothele bispora (strain CBS 962.96) TaxID=1314807 RepID=A0A4S8M4L6_DENBC|nr:hypothetical protein K435DRAFT_796809 [Dendrothele bispora CBS 962.96]